MYMAYNYILHIDGINDDITQPYCLITNPTTLISLNLHKILSKMSAGLCISC